MLSAPTISSGSIARSYRDAPLVGLAVAHGAVLLAFPRLPVIAVGLWWSSQTVAHYAIHRPLFAGRLANRLFGLYLTALLGIPQTLWRDRHLAHHAGRAPRLRFSRRFVVEAGLVLAVWGALALLAPSFFLGAYLPGWLLGLGLCALQGYYEHARGTTSHYGLVYNFLFLNDGYHAEHHVRPAAPWSELPAIVPRNVRASRWPPVLRWLDGLTLERLERRLFRSLWLRDLVVRVHERALAKVVGPIAADARIGIVGGGLFPRTAIVLRRLLPQAKLVVIDMDAEHLEAAKPFLPERVEVVHARFEPGTFHEFDALVFPLALSGDRYELYRRPPAPVVLVHDWLWRRRGRGVVVAAWLCKRVNRVEARC